MRRRGQEAMLSRSEISPQTESQSIAVGLWAEPSLEHPSQAVNLPERLTLRVAVSNKPLEIRTLTDFDALEAYRGIWKTWPGSLASDIDCFSAMLRARG